METHPVVVVVIRALCAHLPRYHDDDHAKAAVATRHGHVVNAIYKQRMDRLNRSIPYLPPSLFSIPLPPMLTYLPIPSATLPSAPSLITPLHFRLPALSIHPRLALASRVFLVPFSKLTKMQEDGGGCPQPNTQGNCPRRDLHNSTSTTFPDFRRG